MPSYFTLTLDTTPPIVTIYSPQYTVQDIATEIVVQANEPLANWQDIYIVDSLGVRHDETFLYQGDKFVGQVSLNGYPQGISILHVRVMDEVYNKSALYTQAIHIMAKNYFTLEIKEQSRKIEMSEQARKVEIYEQVRKIEETTS